MNNPREVFDHLRQSPLFSCISDEVLKCHAARWRAQHFERGERVHRDTDPARWFFLIRRGRVKVMRTSPLGAEMIVGFYGPGDFLGCCSLIEIEKLPCSAQAVEPTDTIAILREDLLTLMNEQPGFAVTMLQALTRRLGISHDRMQDLALDSVDRRIMAVLLELNDRFGVDRPEGGRFIAGRFTRLELAEMAGTTLEGASRTMTKLNRYGWVNSDSHGILLLAPERLTEHLQ